MVQFEQLIEIDEEPLSFSFIRLDTRNKIVVTVNKDRRYFVFYMKQDKGGSWKISDSAPRWVQAAEEKLSNAINRTLRSG